MNLLQEWANWSPKNAPYVLDADAPFILPKQFASATVTWPSWNEAYQAEDFCAPGDTRLHLGLFPQPFIGNLRRATIFLLLLNPGLGPTDYFGEYQVPGFREVIKKSIRQEFSDDFLPFLFLDPQYSWYGGFDWWHSKLTRLIQHLAETWRIPFSNAREALAKSIASIELFPYHSSRYHDPARWLSNLRSVQLARNYVNQKLMPRVRKGEAIVIVTRKTRVWNLPIEKGVIVYSSAQARAAHLTPGSPGGRAIIAHLTERYEI